MENEKEVSFDIKQWLFSKKKGLSGKVPRADFISKIEEFWTEIVDLKRNKEELESKSKEEEKKILTLQDSLLTQEIIVKEKNEIVTKLKLEANKLEKELKEKDNIIQQKITEIKQAEILQNELKNVIKELEDKGTKLLQDLANKQEQIEQKNHIFKEKEEIINSKTEELKKRPNVTNEQYQKLLNNQEKHETKDLRPSNLPIDWEIKLSSIKELESRPTVAELIESVKEESIKYEGYKKLSAEEEDAINNYKKIKSEYEKWVNAFEGETAERIKKEHLRLEKKELEREKEELNVHKILKSEIETLKQKFETYKPYEIKTHSDEIPKQIKELVKIIGSWKPENNDLKKIDNKLEQTFFDYYSLKSENERLWKIIRGLNPFNDDI